MDNSINECGLCQEFATQICPALSPLSNRLLYQTDDFLVFPALGSFVEGYLLVCPRIHVSSCAALEASLLLKLQELLNVVIRLIQSNYGESYVIFEHGMVSRRKRAGGCIDHAHLHIIPGAIDLTSVLSKHFTPEVLVDWSDLTSWKERPYLLVQQEPYKLFICEVPDYLPSQFLRQHAADALNVLAHWDWRSYIGSEEINNTLSRLKVAFAKQFDE